VFVYPARGFVKLTPSANGIAGSYVSFSPSACAGSATSARSLIKSCHSFLTRASCPRPLMSPSKLLRANEHMCRIPASALQPRRALHALAFAAIHSFAMHGERVKEARGKPDISSSNALQLSEFKDSLLHRISV
jgi:hypothetical protein